ncbi:hypothetical protein O0L34_g5783 [Tuta absoluta]|nr:hypothetical protein O0L34_g5783 [Tuta absoluta]
MAGKTVSFNSNCDLLESKFECLARWLSCNGEIWGVGPTVVFASAAALFLYKELEATVFMPGDVVRVTMLEKTLVSTMVLGMLSLMIHLWVCSMRFFQYYLDTLIKDSPNFFLEMTTAGILGSQAEIVPLGPLTRFLRQQQPQIHITCCWFLSLCYADYVRKHYCQRFNLPYLEHWQAELQERASRKVNTTVARVNSFVGAIHQRLRGYAPAAPPQASSEPHTGSATPRCPVSCDPSKISWGCRRGSDPLVMQCKDPGRELCVRLLSQSSETAADAVEKLRNYIASTRCSCSGVPVAGISNAANTSSTETKKYGKFSLEEHEHSSHAPHSPQRQIEHDHSSAHQQNEDRHSHQVAYSAHQQTDNTHSQQAPHSPIRQKSAPPTVEPSPTNSHDDTPNQSRPRRHSQA